MHAHGLADMQKCNAFFLREARFSTHNFLERTPFRHHVFGGVRLVGDQKSKHRNRKLQEDGFGTLTMLAGKIMR